MKMEFHFLDIGPTKFGDCIVCRRGSESILIDGGHLGDWKARGTRRSIPDQLGAILGKAPPFHFKLLVVTHAHIDHIGCLPKLVADGIITAEWALVADEKFGWGRHQSPDGKIDADALPLEARKLAAALREDAIPDLRIDDAVRAFLSDALSLEKSYTDMLQTLQTAGTKITRYGRDSTTSLVKAFHAWPLKILGPTRAHLQICADAISQTMSDAASLLGHELADAKANAVEAYRQLVSAPLSDSAAENRPGAALNNQSIVLAFGPAKRRVLLAGDMQFIEPDLKPIEAEMAALRGLTNKSGKYLLAKTCHHTSHNGLDSGWIADIGDDALLVHSGGENDSTHPALASLATLRKRAATKPRKFLRNDRNGLISCAIADNGKLTITPERGNFDDFSANHEQPDVAPVKGTSEFQIASAPGDGELVEVAFKIPHQHTRVTVTIDIVPGPTADPPPDPERPLAQLPLPTQVKELGGGRKFPKLLAVTDLKRLAENVGESAANRAVDLLREAGVDVQPVLPEEHGSSDDARTVTREALRGGDYAGVLLLGGADVVPLVVVDALPVELRAKMAKATSALRDPDDFIVWSDHPYGDLDGEGVSELPVSRIPDGHSADLLLMSLGAPARADTDTSAFGLRNLRRPFAESIFASLAPGKCLTSALIDPPSFPSAEADAHRIYLMLHGAHDAGDIFVGETEDEEQVEAMRLENLPAACAGSVVFAGCCWGALTVDRLARDASDPQKPAFRTAENSIALAMLRRGARAFVGCTGAHYSPDAAPYKFFDGPMHAAFWEAMKEPGMPPALALHQARLGYLNAIPHGQNSISQVAIEYKIFHQFTCLGLGW